MATEPRAACFDYDDGHEPWQVQAADEVARYFNAKAKDETAKPSRTVRLILTHDRIWRHKRWPLNKRMALCGKIIDQLARPKPSPTSG